jgi:glucose/arabinose dehydrogenase
VSTDRTIDPIERDTVRSRSHLAFTFSFVLAGCSGAVDPAGEGRNDVAAESCRVPGLAHQRVFPALAFSQPVQLLQAPGDATRFFVVEHTGTIKSFANDPAAASTTTFLDLRARTKVIFESGMNGLAFHPDFAHNGQAYVTYNAVTTSSDPSVIEQWRLSRFVSRDGGKTLDPASEQILIALDKRADEHNAGKLAFGADGLLYVSVGDGGPSFDPNRFGQNVNVLFGKFLRIDVDHPAGGLPYGIPSTNPFAAGGGRGEIYAWGLRNPWRWSFDRKTGELWAGDVGQDAYDEIDQITRGGNYGWGNMEGKHCSPMVPTNCRQPGMIDPVLELPHPDVRSVIGGFVYRGSAIPALVGDYVFGDFVSGRISVLSRDGNGAASSQVVDATGKPITAFAEDADGELYFLEYANAAGIYKLAGGPCQSPPTGGGASYHFLMRAGITSEADAAAYYASIDAASTPTLDAWRAANFAALPTVSSYYQNTMDLGFWREMTCTQSIARGAGGCMVRNWRNEPDKDANNPAAPNLGTVTMNVSADGFTRFYVFAPDGKLQPFALLDSEGKKFVPGVCNACHTGHYQGAGAAADLGSIFREFEPSLLRARTGASAQVAEAEWFALNQAVRSANAAIRGEGEGAPIGTDHSKLAIGSYVEEMYPTGAPPARGVHDAAHLPPSWRATLQNPALTSATRALYATTTSAYCMGCHRVNALDFANYATFSSLAALEGGTAVIQLYVDADLSNPNSLPMPQSQLMFTNLHADAPALQAITDWVTEMSNPAVPQCRVSFEIDGADFTQYGDDIWIVGDVPELGGWTPQHGVKLDGSAFPTWRGSVILPQGENAQWKATVITRVGAVGWETGANRTLAVPAQPSAAVIGTWRR